jgi:hypothetical protein
MCTCVSLHVFTRGSVQTRKAPKVRTVATVKRNGKPYTVYLSDDLSRALAEVSEKRRVDKSAIVRVAIERLLSDLENDQLQLPLGIQ